MRLFPRFAALISAIGLFAVGLTGQPASASSSVSPFAAAGSFVEIASAVSNSCLDVTGKSTQRHASVQAFSCTGTSNQLWALAPATGGSFRAVNANSALCLDVASNFPAANGDLLQQFDCVDPGTNQEWIFQPTGSAYRIIDRTTGRCLSFPDTFQNGARIEMWDCITDNIFQLWVLK